MSRYRADWNIIAASIKAQHEYKCSKCRRQFKKGDRRLQVHHCDYTPENNDPSNLVPLCAGCHLEKHQGRRGKRYPWSVVVEARLSFFHPT